MTFKVFCLYDLASDGVCKTSATMKPLLSVDNQRLMKMYNVYTYSHHPLFHMEHESGHLIQGP